MDDLATALGPLGVWGHLDSLDAAAARAWAGHAARHGYGALWVPETVGRDPFALCAAIAEAAAPMFLGTSIVSIFGRDAMAAKLGAQTLHELTGGRFVLGLGVSHAHLVEKLRGHVYAQPLTTMRTYLADIARLPYRGPLPAGTDAVGAPLPERPPVLVAGLRERMLGLAATDADGAFPFLVTPERTAWIRGVLDAAAPAGRRPVLAVTQAVVLATDPAAARAAARAWLAPYLRTANYQVSWAAQGLGPEDWTLPGSDRLVDAMVAWGDAAALRARIAAHHAAGADHVAIIPVAPDGTTEDPDAVAALAPGAARG